jgi:hypothetical protein
MSNEQAHLEWIEFWGALDLDRVHYVKRWKNMKSLRWVIPIDYLGMRLDDVDTDELPASTLMVLERLGEVASKPEISVETTDWIGAFDEKVDEDDNKFVFGNGKSRLPYAEYQ